jgi:hypothetical protein
MPTDVQYAAAIEALVEIIRTWVREHPGACLQLNPPNFNAIVPDPVQREALRKQYAALLPGQTMGIIADLDVVIDWWGGNEDTKQLLRHLDKASGQQATYQMADIAIKIAFKGVGDV